MRSNDPSSRLTVDQWNELFFYRFLKVQSENCKLETRLYYFMSFYSCEQIIG